MLKYLVYCTMICVNAFETPQKTFNPEYLNYPRSNEEDLFNLKYPANHVDLAAILESMIIYRTMLNAGGSKQITSRPESDHLEHRAPNGKSFYRRTVNLHDEQDTTTEVPNDSYQRQQDSNYNSYISKIRRHRTTDEVEDRKIKSEEEEEETTPKKNYYMLFSRRPAQLKTLKEVIYEMRLKNRQN